MIRIERDKEGTLRVYVRGQELRLPDKGQAIILTPRTDYQSHLENSRDRDR